MAATVVSGTLRISISLMLVSAAALAGFWLRSPLIILLIGLAFTIGYIAGKQQNWRGIGVKALLLNLPVAYLIQLILVGILYLIGLGVASLLGRSGVADALTTTDFWHAAAIAALGLVAGLVLEWLETERNVLRGADNELVDDENEEQEMKPTEPRAEIALLGAPVTLQNFYGNIHYSHATDDGDEAQRFSPNEMSAGSEAKIVEAEARLGQRLPAALRALYLVQNGGSLEDMCVPKPDCTKHYLYDHIITPFSGYSDLHPLEYIVPLHEAMCAYADPQDEADRFPAGSERMMILARWYEQTLYLDYNQLNASGEPAVCFTAFEDQQMLHTQKWPDFATFFAALRFFESV